MALRRKAGETKPLLNFRPVLFLLGILLAVLSVFMLVPAIADYAENNPDWQGFCRAAALTFFTGTTLMLMTRTDRPVMNIRQAFVMTVLAWLLLPAMAALPFTFADLDMDYTNAYFEAMSGLTTTGATVMTNLQQMPPGILLWRSILQGLGGIGILVMAVALLPILRVGGMQLFRMEFSERLEKGLPRAAEVGFGITMIYGALILTCAILYWLGGMSAFDAANHAMTTLSNGGFSTRDESFGAYDSWIIDVTAVVFMTAGALPFVLYLRAVNQDIRALLTDSQVHWFLMFLGGAIFILTAYLVLKHEMGSLAILRETIFSAGSIMTGTGFVITDYQLWGTFPQILFFILMFVGGCAGSASCGLKIFRFQVLFQAVRIQLNKLVKPHGVFIPQYNRRALPETVMEAVVVYFFVFMVIYAIITAVLAMLGLDFLTAASAAVSMLSCVGPGLGDIIGPSGNYAPLSAPVKWVLAMAMLLGRLELMTVLAVLTPAFWKS